MHGAGQPASELHVSGGDRLRARRVGLILVVVALGAVGVTSVALATVARRVSGPALVRPGARDTVQVSGFAPGASVYVTVSPQRCRGGAGACDLSPCPGCAPTRISREGRATITFRWPRRSYLALGGMTARWSRWAPGSRAQVDVDLVATHVPRGCVRTPSLTANPDAGTIRCAQQTVRIEASSSPARR